MIYFSEMRHSILVSKNAKVLYWQFIMFLVRALIRSSCSLSTLHIPHFSFQWTLSTKHWKKKKRQPKPPPPPPKPQNQVPPVHSFSRHVCLSICQYFGKSVLHQWKIRYLRIFTHRIFSGKSYWKRVEFGGILSVIKALKSAEMSLH